MSSRWTAQDVANLKQYAPKPSKYRNVKTTVDGIVFDSKREAVRWQELRLRQEAGEIAGLRRQVRFALHCPLLEDPAVVGEYAEVAAYLADFVYVERGWRVVEDVKGAETAIYRLKKKWLQIQDGIQIREIR